MPYPSKRVPGIRCVRIPPPAFPFACPLSLPYTAPALSPYGDRSKPNERLKTMKHWLACVAPLVLLTLTGCDTVTHSQLHVLAPKPQRGAKATVPASERETVKRVLTDI